VQVKVRVVDVGKGVVLVEREAVVVTSRDPDRAATAYAPSAVIRYRM
jgi:hypothetical protein